MFDLKTKTSKTIIKIACMTIALIAVLSLTACMKSQAPATEEEQPITPSQYMTNVNEVAENLAVSLGSFTEAVKANDLSAIQSRADSAYAILDELDSLEAPESLNDVKQKYSEATNSLKSALNDYITLYTEVKDSNKANPFDFDDYSERLESIQKQYDSGLNMLEEADKLAAGK